MAKRYDATLKHIFDVDPEKLVALLRLAAPIPEGPASALDSDLSTVSPAGDRLLRLGDHALLQVEVQASPDPELVRRALVYNVLAGWRHRLPVETVILLLRPQADHPAFADALALAPAGGATRIDFRYSVVRLWRLPAEPLLADARLAPLAPLTDAAAGDVAGTVRRAAARIEQDQPGAANELVAATRILLGLRYNAEQIVTAFLGVHSMRESVVYQQILQEGVAQGVTQGLAQGVTQGLAQGVTQGLAQGETLGRRKGRAEEARRLLLKIGARKLGPASAETVARLAALADPEPLEDLFDKLESARTWDELFAA